MFSEPTAFRPPDEHDAWVLSVTVAGEPRPLQAILDDLDRLGTLRPHTDRIFAACERALALPVDVWVRWLDHAHTVLPGLRHVSCHAFVGGLRHKTDGDIDRLVGAGLTAVYTGDRTPEDPRVWVRRTARPLVIAP
ncbi:MAG: hypothetical protein AAGA48_30305 [Myxococcota bacterium]